MYSENSLNMIPPSTLSANPVRASRRIEISILFAASSSARRHHYKDFSVPKAIKYNTGIVTKARHANA